MLKYFEKLMTRNFVRCRFDNPPSIPFLHTLIDTLVVYNLVDVFHSKLSDTVNTKCEKVINIDHQ